MAVNSPQGSIGIALGTGALVWATFSSTLPPIANVRATLPGNKALNSSRRTATAISAGIVGLVYWLTKDPIPVIVGGSLVVALDAAHRHADAVHPASQTVINTAGYGPSDGAQSSGIKSSAGTGGY
jgi:hypothetical protein